MNRVSNKQIQEWTENPVTLALKDALQLGLDDIAGSSPTNCLVRGEPELTQENLIESATQELEWTLFIDLLSGDWSELEIDNVSYEDERETFE
jgi:hypothetical protein